jgi:Protein of unknown function (DUF3710)
VSIFRRGRPEQDARHGRGGESRSTETSSDPEVDEAFGAPTVSDPGVEAATPEGERVLDDVAARGPFDREDVESLNGRLDLGSLWITGVPGMELRLEVDEESGQLVGATAVIGESALQMQAFAAPRTAGIWDDVRDELAQSIATRGGTAEEAEGPIGTELLTRMPSAGPDGRTVFAPARFIGVDGPRWFLRAVLSGRAAIEDDAAAPLMDVLRRVVVVRGPEPMAPREVLPLTLPDHIRPSAPAPGQDDLSPFERGPEITEVR